MFSETRPRACSSRESANLITDAADGSHTASAELAAKIMHIGIHHSNLLGIGKHIFENFIPAEHATRPPSELFQQRALTIGQDHHRTVGEGDAARSKLEGTSGDSER